MTGDEARDQTIDYLFGNAEESLQSADSEAAAGRTRFAINRAYYACFYAASAVLLAEGRQFVRHAGVRAAIHRHLAKPGRIVPAMARVYDQLFQDRQTGDYGVLVQFSAADAAGRIAEAKAFVHEMNRLLGRP